MTSIVKEEHVTDNDDNVLDSLYDITAHLIKVNRNDDASNAPALTVHIACIDSENGTTCFTASLYDSMTTHILTSRILETNEYTSETFYALFIDNGCSHSSSGGLEQYGTYCR